MAPNPRRRDARLEELYRRVPRIACQGRCADSCGPIEMSARERERIERHAGRPVEIKGVSSLPDERGDMQACLNCSMLTDDGRCSVYELRPMICRLWGVTEGMRCPYGCQAERILSDRESIELLTEASKVGGHPEGWRVAEMEAVIKAVSDPETLRWALQLGGLSAGAKADAAVARRLYPDD